ncbi:hypothetical protein [Pseudomonas sp. KCJK9000]|uniref:hypothetical protein n=1 Tax=Pseudomonas sp. KCJK9000 TaxID=3344566 RepID=UPI003905FCFE
MANEWIKIRSKMVTNRKVEAIARRLASNPQCLAAVGMQPGLDYSDKSVRNGMRNVTVSLLVTLWGTANEESRNGVLENVDRYYIDDLVQMPGFTAALELVGWAVCDDAAATITLPNFEEYNTASHDRRGMHLQKGRERSQRYRDKQKAKNGQNPPQEEAPGNVTGDVTNNVTNHASSDGVTPLEKRREEYIDDDVDTPPPPKVGEANDESEETENFPADSLMELRRPLGRLWKLTKLLDPEVHAELVLWRAMEATGADVEAAVYNATHDRNGNPKQGPGSIKYLTPIVEQKIQVRLNQELAMAKAQSNPITAQEQPSAGKGKRSTGTGAPATGFKTRNIQADVEQQSADVIAMLKAQYGVSDTQATPPHDGSDDLEGEYTHATH